MQRLQPYRFFCISSSLLNTEYGNGAYSYREQSCIEIATYQPFQWHPASYFTPNSPPAAISARTKSTICMGAGLHLCNSARGGAAHAL